MKKSIIILTSLLAVLAFSLPGEARSQDSSVVTTKIKDVQPVQKVNLNTAGASEIANALTGVGMKKATAIVEYRKAYGKFMAVEDLASVKGIGVATIAKNEGRIILN